MTVLVMNGCDSIYLNLDSASKLLHQQKKLVVLTVRNPFTVSNVSGIDHDLIENFAAANDIQVEFRYKSNESEILRALNLGEGDIGAARFLQLNRMSEQTLGPTYEETHLNLYCHKSVHFQQLSDLNFKKIIFRSFEYDPNFGRWLKNFAPNIDISVRPNLKHQQIFRLVQNQKYDCAILENLNGAFYEQFYSRVTSVFQFENKISLNWIISPNKKYLNILMKAWFQEAARNNDIIRVLDLYRSHLTQNIAKSEVYHFLQSSRKEMISYSEYFQSAGRVYSIPWRLLSALSYQESRWNKLAVSHRGAKGLMQITDSTAEHLGLIDSLDAETSIFAAAKYLRLLIDEFPKTVHLNDRIALALAAYNMGIGHLSDAQKFAEIKGLNPYSWQDLKLCLPYLADSTYSDIFQYGYANTKETVQFVDRVFNFQNLLAEYY